MYAGFGKLDGATFRPESHMDFEVEMGIWLSKPVPRNQRLKIGEAKDHIFGLTLLNDWSARQLQGYEMAPLGPFHSKGTATTVSSWIVPIEALRPASCATRTKQEPGPPPHLTWPEDDTATFDVDITLVLLRGCLLLSDLTSGCSPMCYRRREILHDLRDQSQRAALDTLSADNPSCCRW
jgi:hypothetical protein